MKSLKVKFLSTVFALTMTASFASISVYAEEPANTEPSKNAHEIQQLKYQQLEQSINRAKVGIRQYQKENDVLNKYYNECIQIYESVFEMLEKHFGVLLDRNIIGNIIPQYVWVRIDDVSQNLKIIEDFQNKNSEILDANKKAYIESRKKELTSELSNLILPLEKFKFKEEELTIINSMVNKLQKNKEELHKSLHKIAQDSDEELKSLNGIQEAKEWQSQDMELELKVLREKVGWADHEAARLMTLSHIKRREYAVYSDDLLRSLQSVNKYLNESCPLNEIISQLKQTGNSYMKVHELRGQIQKFLYRFRDFIINRRYVSDIYGRMNRLYNTEFNSFHDKLLKIGLQEKSLVSGALGRNVLDLSDERNVQKYCIENSGIYVLGNHRMHFGTYENIFAIGDIIPGDLIYAVNLEKITNSKQLSDIWEKCKSTKKKMIVSVIRNGKLKDIEVKIARKDEEVQTKKNKEFKNNTWNLFKLN